MRTMRVYVAGKLNDDAVGYINNLRAMFFTAERVRKAGFAVFVPGLDFLMGVVIGGWEYSDYFDNSQPWLAASDAVFVGANWKTSAGTAREIEYAESLGIPVFLSREMLREWGEACEQDAAI